MRGSWANLKSPASFDEKLIWLNLDWRHPMKTLCGDKYTLRSYVKGLGFGKALPHLHGVYENSNEIVYNVLTERFVLKCSHGCGFNVICNNKADLGIELVKRKLNAWMKVNFSKRYGELHYSSMKPRIRNDLIIIYSDNKPERVFLEAQIFELEN